MSNIQHPGIITPSAEKYGLDLTNTIVRPSITADERVFELRVPSTIEGFDKIYGEGEALRLAVTHKIFHEWNGAFREALVDKLVDLTKVEVPEVNGKPMTEDKFLKWIASQNFGPGTEAAGELIGSAFVTQVATEVFESMCFLTPFDSRRGEGKKSKEVIEKGTAKFNDIKAGRDTAENFAARFEANNPGRPFASLGSPDSVDTYISAYHINFLRVKREAEKRAKEADMV